MKLQEVFDDMNEQDRAYAAELASLQQLNAKEYQARKAGNDAEVARCQQAYATGYKALLAKYPEAHRRAVSHQNQGADFGYGRGRYMGD